jgi:hypothetical protein
MFLACRRFRVRRKGKYEWTVPGEELPEAEYWPNLEACIKSGYVREVKRLKKEEPKPEKKPLPSLSERKKEGSVKKYRKKRKSKLKDSVSAVVTKEELKDG